MPAFGHRQSTTPRVRPRWSAQTKWTVSMVLLAFAVYLVFRFSEVLPPLVLAVVLAYVISPLVRWLEQRTPLGRGWATALVYLLLLGVVAALLAVGVPLLVSQAAALNVKLEALVTLATQALNRPLSFFGHTVDGTTLITQMQGAWQSMAQVVLGQGLNVAVGVLATLGWSGFILVISFYLVKDAAQLRAYVESLVPRPYLADYIRLREEIGAVWSAFFRGQVTLALVVTAIITTLALLVGLPGALPMGLLAGLLEFLPSIGHGIWLTIAATLAFFFGSTWWPMPHWAFALLVAALHVLFDQLDTNYLIPRIIGRRVRLHPLVVILGIVAGALIGGVLGIALAAPTIASLRVLGRYVYANLIDADPFPGEVSEPLPAPDPHWWQKTPVLRRLNWRARRNRRPVRRR